MNPYGLCRNSPVSPPNTSDEASCWEAAVTVDDVDAGEDKPTSWVTLHTLGCDCSAVGGTTEESTLVFAGLFPVMGLHTSELSSGQRKTSIGPWVLLSDT